MLELADGLEIFEPGKHFLAENVPGRRVINIIEDTMIEATILRELGEQRGVRCGASGGRG